MIPCNCEQALALKALLTRAREQLEAIPQAFGRTVLLLDIDEALRASECTDADCPGFHADDDVEPYPTPTEVPVAHGDGPPDRCAHCGATEGDTSYPCSTSPHDCEVCMACAEAAGACPRSPGSYALTAEVARLKAERDAARTREVDLDDLLVDRTRAYRDDIQRAEAERDAARGEVASQGLAASEAIAKYAEDAAAARGEVERLRAAMVGLLGAIVSEPQNRYYQQSDRLTGVAIAARAALQPAPVQSAANQCDGCLRGLPVGVDGNHRGGGRDKWDLRVCTADRYTTPDPQSKEPGR